MQSLRYIVLAPTFNNARTLAGVVEAVLALDLPVLVVDDGSTDDTPSILRKFNTTIDVVTHPHNAGKAQALRTGLTRAAHLGYTHAVTIDTDAQHVPADLPALIDVSRLHPAAVVLGTRDSNTLGYPIGSRVGRVVSNVLIHLHSGARVTDSQCGLRVYPLSTRLLPVRARRYGYETEILVHAAWARVRLIDHPVQCLYEIPSGRVSHFRPWPESLRRRDARKASPSVALADASDATGRLRRAGDDGDDRVAAAEVVRPRARVARRPTKPRRSEAVRGRAVGRRAGREPAGLRTAIGPVAPCRAKTSLTPARGARGVTRVGAPVGPLLVAAAIGTGHYLIHGQLATFSEFDPARLGYVELLRRVAIEWTLGSLVCGLTLATLTFLLVQTTLRLLPTPTKTPAGPA